LRPPQDLDELCVNTLRMLALDMVQEARSGHPGLPLGAAPMAYVLWSRFMRFCPQEPLWPNRDRFVLSAGHGSALLYALLHLLGYGLSLQELRRFRQWGSKTPGHPEHLPEAGIETTTGPLGQGFATAVGMAMAEAHLGARFNRPGFQVVRHYTYVLLSDGDLMEGVSAEAASLAGHLRLARLLCLYDSNQISLAGQTRLTFTEDVPRRFRAQGWYVREVPDGNDLDAIQRALAACRAQRQRPSLVLVRTRIGYGSPREGTYQVHGSPLSPEEALATKRRFGWPQEPFHVPQEARGHFQEIARRASGQHRRWQRMMRRYASEHPGLYRKWQEAQEAKLSQELVERALEGLFSSEEALATRVAGGRAMNALLKEVPWLLGGSADLDPSTNTVLQGLGSFQAPGTGDASVQGAVPGPWGYEGRNLAFGVREHAMGAALNGLALHGGLIPFGATFLIFSDYMRPPMRLAALMGLRVIYVFTHDSVALGQDGPTHQPVEHLAGLRAIPNLLVVRPADATETVQAWRLALTHEGGPVALILTRQKVPVIDRGRFAPAEGLLRGAYVLADSAGRLRLVLLATGSEVHLALEAWQALRKEGLEGVRVVSMPCWELFEAQPPSYRQEVLPPGSKRLSLEAGAGMGWHKYVGQEGRVLSLERFGASAPGEVVMEKLGFTVGEVLKRARELLKEA